MRITEIFTRTGTLRRRQLRESSFNMIKEGMKILRRRGALKIFRHPKGGLRKFVYLKTNRRGGGGGDF